MHTLMLFRILVSSEGALNGLRTNKKHVVGLVLWHWSLCLNDNGGFCCRHVWWSSERNCRLCCSIYFNGTDVKVLSVWQSPGVYRAVNQCLLKLGSLKGHRDSWIKHEPVNRHIVSAFSSSRLHHQVNADPSVDWKFSSSVPEPHTRNTSHPECWYEII